MNEKEILSKLLKIATNQQKIIQRLAQQQDPNVTYLRSAANITAMNSGFNPTEITVTAKPGAAGSDPSVQLGSGYTVTIGGAPNKNEVRDLFTRQLKAMVASQKPDQAGLQNLSVIFA